MKVLMFGWEFPPIKSGGLGTACHDLTKGLARNGAEVTFVMPTAPDTRTDFVKLIGANQYAKNTIGIPSTLRAYGSADDYEPQNTKMYGKDVFSEAKRFASVAGNIARKESHDVIHVHDWMTYEAGVEARKISGKPLVAHIHATEDDRTGGNPNPDIVKMERQGLREADLVIANSEYTKKNVIKQYKLPAKKVKVVHWGIEQEVPASTEPSTLNERKIVLFLGRMTVQKGPEQFIEAAKRVLQFEPDTLFVIAGDGDRLPHVITKAHELGISDHVLFTGFLNGEDVQRAFQMADVYVMPSVSEPFGLVALESLKNNTPIIISKQSGVSEVIQHCLKTDYWNITELTNMIVNVLRNPALREELQENGNREVQGLTIDGPARKVMALYQEVSA